MRVIKCLWRWFIAFFVELRTIFSYIPRLYHDFRHDDQDEFAPRGELGKQFMVVNPNSRAWGVVRELLLRLVIDLVLLAWRLFLVMLLVCFVIVLIKLAVVLAFIFFVFFAAAGAQDDKRRWRQEHPQQTVNVYHVHDDRW